MNEHKFDYVVDSSIEVVTRQFLVCLHTTVPKGNSHEVHEVLVRMNISDNNGSDLTHGLAKSSRRTDKTILGR